MSDCISRQAAMSLAKDICVPTKDGSVHRHRCIDPDDILELPSAQPDIIRCKDCKYAEVADTEDSQDGYSCQFHRGSIWFSGSYCSWAERKEE